MVIFLSILKVIGIILIFIISLILLLLLIVMVTPIKYYIDFEKYESINGEVRVYWLFKSVNFYCVFDEKFNFYYDLKIFGKSFNNHDKIKSDSIVATEKNSYSDKEYETDTNSKKTYNDNNKNLQNDETDTNGKKTYNNNNKNLQNDETDTNSKETYNDNNKNLQNDEIDTNSKKPYSDKGFKRVNVCEIEKDKKPNKIKESFDFFNSIENKKEILKATIKYLKNIFKNISPNDICVNIKIGTSDPALTGYIMGAYGICKSIYGDNINIVAHFECFKIEGIINAKGKILIGKLVIDTAIFIFTKPILNLIKMFLKK